MKFRDEATDLTVQIRAENHELSEREREDIEADLDILRKVVSDFPVASLHIDIHRFPQRRDFHVRASLHVSKHDFFTGERETVPTQAVERCVRKLVNKVKSFKQIHTGKPRQSRIPKGAVRQIAADWQPDLDSLERAVREQDYLSFREAMRVYDDSLTARLGRWISRFPEFEAGLGEGLVLSEIVEEVYLNAFEQFPGRGAGPVAVWLEHLIDPSIRNFMAHSESERRKIEYFDGLGLPRVEAASDE